MYTWECRKSSWLSQMEFSSFALSSEFTAVSVWFGDGLLTSHCCADGFVCLFAVLSFCTLSLTWSLLGEVGGQMRLIECRTRQLDSVVALSTFVLNTKFRCSRKISQPDPVHIRPAEIFTSLFFAACAAWKLVVNGPSQRFANSA